MTSGDGGATAGVSAVTGTSTWCSCGKYLAEPSDCTAEVENRAQDADRSVGQQAGKNQRSAESHDERPRRGRGQYDILGISGYVLVGRFHCDLKPPQMAMKYTTVSTTTQIASTKCQYMAKTSMRGACSCFTYPSAAKIMMIERPIRPTIT